MAATEDEGNARAGASILIVDDEPGMRHFLARLLGPRVRRLPRGGIAGRGGVSGIPAIENLDSDTRRHIPRIHDLCGGNRAGAARRLGVSRKTIDRKLAAQAE